MPMPSSRFHANGMWHSSTMEVQMQVVGISYARNSYKSRLGRPKGQGRSDTDLQEDTQVTKLIDTKLHRPAAASPVACVPVPAPALGLTLATLLSLRPCDLIVNLLQDPLLVNLILLIR